MAQLTFSFLLTAI